MTFKMSGPSAEHLRGLWFELDAVLPDGRPFEVAPARAAINGMHSTRHTLLFIYLQSCGGDAGRQTSLMTDLATMLIWA
jgi:hypothetical protein